MLISQADFKLSVHVHTHPKSKTVGIAPFYLPFYILVGVHENWPNFWLWTLKLAL